MRILGPVRVLCALCCISASPVLSAAVDNSGAKNEKPAAAGSEVVAAALKWRACVIDHSKRFARSTAPAGDIADAALAACRPYREILVQVIARAQPGNREEKAQEALLDSDKAVRDLAIETISELRK